MSMELKQALIMVVKMLMRDASETNDKVYADECRHMAKQIKSLIEAYGE